VPISLREFIRRLRALGFEGPEAGGRHQMMIKGELRLPIPNPHGSQDIDDALLRRVLRVAGISREEFDDAGHKRGDS
jgi:predicted RNA binding protein YcfA (HicA-like mRNA interferase family)